VQVRGAPDTFIDPLHPLWPSFGGHRVVTKPMGHNQRKGDSYKKTNDLKVGGAAYRIRTCDPIITNDVLYQLS
jgi:hypothetical protein